MSTAGNPSQLAAATPLSSTPIPEAAHWAQHLQRRIMRLLLLHDRSLFRGHFRTFYTGSTLPALPLLQQYDRFIRLVALGDELLDDILPRIRRQLSLQTSQTRLRESAPTRGDIDWRRTTERSWRETPGLPPIEFDTRLRQRSHATPENLLAVAILLNFQRTVRAALDDILGDEALTAEERATLISADERAARELAAAYARSLLEAARQADVATLADTVSARLRPGLSPYKDLVVWWRAFSGLRIGRDGAAQQQTLASQRDDDKRDAWLYELWIALELAHFLDGEHAITPAATAVQPDLLRFTFTWHARDLCFTYNRQRDETGTSADAGWSHAPGARPDYTIERAQPLEVRSHNQLVWREPPVVMDAKYYLAGADPARTHGPIKKLLGDTVLLSARQCMLIFPRLPDPPDDAPMTRIVQQKPTRHGGGLPHDLQVQLWKLAPTMPVAALQERLRALLDQASAALPERVPVACHGVWLDPDTHHAAATRSLTGILCPKPHIGADVFDLVDRTRDCLTNPRVCHVIGQPIVPPLVLRVNTADELDQQAQTIRTSRDQALEQAERAGDTERAEDLRQHIFTGVGRTIERYVKLRGNTAAIEATFEQWVFGEYWQRHLRALAPDVRDMLLSGEYVWHEYQQTSMIDWAAPAIQYCRALERELKRRFCDANYKTTYQTSQAGWTLGTPLHAFRQQAHHPKALHNWRQMCTVALASGTDVAALTELMQRLDAAQISSQRNDLAHGQAIPQTIAEAIRQLIIGSRSQPGVLVQLCEQFQPLMP